jgi:hypothetical protein
MSEGSIRTLAWREQKRQEGYQPVTVWLPAVVKNAMVNISFQRHQDLGELITEAFQAWSQAKGSKPLSFTDPRQIQAMIDDAIREALAHATAPPPIPPPPGLPDGMPPTPEAKALPPPPTGWKQCRRGHTPYPASKDGCPQCGTERKRASRARIAALRQGEMPT